MIELVGKELYQWDVGRYVQITGIEADEAHFANKGDLKAPIMDIADSQARIPDYLLQTGKQLCVYAVKDGITVESKTFYVQKRERPENYVYEDDRRNYIYELVTNAETAIDGANTATAIAKLAAGDANTATASANQAAESANASANSASLAAKSANEAADKANHTAKSLMVVGSAKGDSIYLDDAIDQFFVGMRIFGKTTQDGTPTPEAPVALVSVENPAVTVNDQTLLVPYTLHGVPVASGGNYTDANGQQWICDEVDFARGVYVQRINTITPKSTVRSYDNSAGTNRVVVVEDDALYSNGSVVGVVMCDSLPTVTANDQYLANESSISIAYRNVTITIKDVKSENAVMQWLKDNPIKIQYALATPVETPLSAEELAAFATLRTYRGNTTVSNDASAHMEIEYVMDAKKYIDSLVMAPASHTRIVYVNLPASKWKGSGTLYSQTVSIAGVTENSQVNLAPSVEQLSIFYEKDITFVTENDSGVVTVYVIGQKPQNDYTIQADIVEVIT